MGNGGRGGDARVGKEEEGGREREGGGRGEEGGGRREEGGGREGENLPSAYNTKSNFYKKKNQREFSKCFDSKNHEKCYGSQGINTLQAKI